MQGPKESILHPQKQPLAEGELPGRALTETEFPAVIRELSHLYFLSRNDFIRCFMPLCSGLQNQTKAGFAKKPDSIASLNTETGMGALHGESREASQKILRLNVNSY